MMVIWWWQHIYNLMENKNKISHSQEMYKYIHSTLTGYRLLYIYNGKIMWRNRAVG